MGGVPCRGAFCCSEEGAQRQAMVVVEVDSGLGEPGGALPAGSGVSCRALRLGLAAAVDPPAPAAEPARPKSARNAGSGVEPLDALLQDLEQTAALALARYRCAIRHPEADADATHRANELMRRLHLQLRRAALCKVSSWCGDEAELWVGMHTGGQKRFRSLQQAVRQVQVETKILRRWGGKRSALINLPAHVQVRVDIDAWDKVDVFQLEEDSQQPLTQVFMAVWGTRKLDLLCKTPAEDVLKFVQSLEGAYRANPYHNRLHAAEVTLAAYYFWTQLAAQGCMQGYYAEADLLVILCAAAIHDVAHPGVSNEFLVKTQNALALQYSDRSVLEHYHAATAFALMKDAGISLLEHKLVSPPADALKARVVDVVLATDMARHKQVVDDMAAEVKVRANMQDIDKLVMERHMVHMADLGHPLRPLALHQRWSSLVRQEFLAQGDMERELGHQPGPLFDREKAPSLARGQIGFLNFVVLPTWKPLCQVLGPCGRVLDGQLRANLAHWEELAKQEEAQLQRKPASPCRSRRTTTGF